jgi:rhamnogalacturonyl hydrolase YesR
MKKQTRTILSLLLLFSIVFFSCNTKEKKKSSITEKRKKLSSNKILEITKRVADYQLRNPHDTLIGDWVQGPFINSLMALGKLPNCQKYIDSTQQIGIRENWGVISTQHYANDHCTPQSWIELYELKKDKKMIAKIQHVLDENMATVFKLDDDVRFKRKNFAKWSWCDALYMSPPTYARLAKVTGDKKYLNFLNEWWWKVSDFYYDKEEQLYFRDETFFTKREPNGKKVFWSRGNGWVIGGLVRVLEYLPKDNPFRPKYEKQLAEMCNTMKDIQGLENLWHSGLLDNKAHPQSETSGSAFILYGLAYAINNNIIDRDTYYPVVVKGWTALCKYVSKEGYFSGIQPIGDKPKEFNKNNSMPYGVGAFILAGTEIYKLSLN